MAGWNDFREIAAWQHAQAVKIRVYDLLERPRIKRDYEYSRQLRDAARSAPANIAEGFGRFGNKEFARFVRIAKAISAAAGLIRHLERTADGPRATRNPEPTSEPNPEPNLEPGTRNPEPKKPK